MAWFLNIRANMRPGPTSASLLRSFLKLAGNCLILSPILFVLHCQARSEPESPLADPEVWALGTVLYLASQPGPVQYQSSECTQWSEPLNESYEKNSNWGEFSTDYRQYTTVIIGDSTMDYSDNYAGFLTPGVQSVAIGGNTLCDMITQLPAINTESPAHVVVSSAGGNEILRGVSRPNMYDSASLLMEALRNRFPDAQITVVDVHPTLLSSVNSEKEITNPEIQNDVLARPNTCWIETAPIFGVTGSDPAPAGMMLDNIHYDSTVSFQIKDALINDCGVAFP